jgi:hypothetical protein
VRAGERCKRAAHSPFRCCSGGDLRPLVNNMRGAAAATTFAIRENEVGFAGFGGFGLARHRVEGRRCEITLFLLWCRVRESNSRPTVYKTAALPLS